MTNREWFNKLSNFGLAPWLIQIREESIEDYDWEEELISGYIEPYYLTPNQETYVNYEDALEATIKWLEDERNEI